jgi:hypothetical protein
MEGVPDLRPRSGHPFVTLLGSLAGAAAVAWAVVRWAATTPTRDEFEHVRNDVVQVRLDQAVQKAASERTSSDVAEIKAALGEIRKTQLEARRR